MVIDYKKGKIYKIINDINDEIYVGSTVLTLAQRLGHHKEASVKCPNTKIYKFIRDNGGWSHFKIILIEDYPCERKEQLLMREQYYKETLKATLNNNNCFGQDKERYKQYSKQFYEQHIDELKQQMKQHYNENKDKILPRIKQYQNMHKDKIKQYLNKHKDKIKQYQKQYREQHKTKVQCPNCLKTLLSSNLEKHMLTRTCKTYYVEQYFRTNYAFDDCKDEEYNLKYIE